MTEHNHQLEPERLEQAIEALRGLPVPEGPLPDLVASTIGALQSCVVSSDTLRMHERRQLMFRIVRFSGVAAVILALAGFAGFLWIFDRTAALTFADMVQKVKDAKTVSFTIKSQFGNQPELKTKISIKGDVLRYEFPGFLVMIVDTNKRKGIQLDLTRKVVKAIDLEGEIPAELLQNPIEQFRSLKQNYKDNVEQQNEEELDGRKCQVYVVKGAKAVMLLPDHFKTWVDAKTGLPVKIHINDEKTSILYEQFKWDQPLADELFSMAVPKGFTLEAFTPAQIKPGRIEYHRGGRDLYSIQPDGKNAETQFMPQFAGPGEGFVSDRSELSPDGRYLAVGFTSSRQQASYPPDRVLLWDRTHPTEKPAEIQPRPEVELQAWQWSADGARLYVSWWEADPGQEEAKGRYDAAVVDVKTKNVLPLKLPTYQDERGHKQAMRFAAASADGQTLLVVGQALHVATADGKEIRRISPASAGVIPASVRISPDGKQVLFATFHADLSQQLFLVPLAGGAPKELIPADQMTEIQARWSPDGKRIAYTCRLYDSQHSLGHGKEKYLRLANSDGSSLVTLLKEQIHPNGSGLELIAWR